MVKFSLASAFLAVIAGTHAGDDVVAPRRSFRESATYPHIFRPEGYLATSGPVPMRIDPKPAAFSKRLAPPLPENAKGKEKPLPPLPDEKAEKAEGADEIKTKAGGKKEELPLPEPDLGKVPEAVLRFFRDRDTKEAKDGKHETRTYLFDPIFLPAKPGELSKSKATYEQKP